MLVSCTLVKEADGVNHSAGTALSLTLRYSRTQEGAHYLASVAVIYTEAIKLALCLMAQMLLCR